MCYTKTEIPTFCIYIYEIYIKNTSNSKIMLVKNDRLLYILEIEWKVCPILLTKVINK